jgi:hypothetical protein
VLALSFTKSLLIAHCLASRDIVHYATVRELQCPGKYVFLLMKKWMMKYRGRNLGCDAGDEKDIEHKLFLESAVKDKEYF